VSHNMPSIRSLCNKGVLLENGSVKESGEITYIIDKYFSIKKKSDAGLRNQIPNNSIGYFSEWFIENSTDFSVYSDESFNISFKFLSFNALENCELGLVFRNIEDKIVLGCNSRDYGGNYINVNNKTAQFTFSLRLPVINGEYQVDIVFVSQNTIIDQWVSTTKLIVKNRFESVLDKKWRGDLNLKTHFIYEVY